MAKMMMIIIMIINFKTKLMLKIKYNRSNQLMNK